MGAEDLAADAAAVGLPGEVADGKAALIRRLERARFQGREADAGLLRIGDAAADGARARIADRRRQRRRGGDDDGDGGDDDGEDEEEEEEGGGSGGDGAASDAAAAARSGSAKRARRD